MLAWHIMANPLNIFEALRLASGSQVIDIKCRVFLDALNYLGTLGVFIEIIGGHLHGS